MSVKDQVSKMLVLDDNSTDNTVNIINSISDPKIKFSISHLSTPRQHTEMRNKMLAQTKTDWFLLLDGDEIWNESTLSQFLKFLAKQPPSIYAVAMRTRNCVGDIYHYLPEDSGKYELLGRKGHLTIRAYRKLPGFHWEGEYPLEKYCDDRGMGVNNLPEHLAFFDGFYWHMTHLLRSSSNEGVKGWRKTKIEKGIQTTNLQELPEVFQKKAPTMVPSPLSKRSPLFELTAHVITPLKFLKRRL